MFTSVWSTQNSRTCQRVTTAIYSINSLTSLIITSVEIWPQLWGFDFWQLLSWFYGAFIFCSFSNIESSFPQLEFWIAKNNVDWLANKLGLPADYPFSYPKSQIWGDRLSRQHVVSLTSRTSFFKPSIRLRQLGSWASNTFGKWPNTLASRSLAQRLVEGTKR